MDQERLPEQGPPDEVVGASDHFAEVAAENRRAAELPDDAVVLALITGFRGNVGGDTHTGLTNLSVARNPGPQSDLPS